MKRSFTKIAEIPNRMAAKPMLEPKFPASVKKEKYRVTSDKRCVLYISVSISMVVSTVDITNSVAVSGCWLTWNGDEIARDSDGFVILKANAAQFRGAIRADILRSAPGSGYCVTRRGELC